MDIAILLFDGITPLDAIGPFEVLGKLPGATVKTVGKSKGEVRTKGQSLAMIADYALTDVEKPDIVVIPGGPGADALAEDTGVTGWVARAHETTAWTTSVCTGALILGGAGVLKGLKATTHWRAMKDLQSFGAIATDQRVVREGKVVTAAGVSSGIDMALMLAAEIAGDEVAKAIQLGIEYAPEPPFDAGHIRDAPQDRIEMVRSGLSRP
ncbi:MAG: DJ-1/PfpI family protein [Rhodospirillales bacterium]|nr:DJ-1/PfpI family protein [Alphaproteobacteria bacterium]MBL6947855.1 DJ-1/PfpI family protein [Rhodospirillales bacterium]